ncbi:titin homolog [Amphiprion ocellaris]|uniref:titin homolog n=1 Tax=Amphiprion ocellaris TaxID=80972 RepID=UPI002410BA0C|nr:titin homolog [Amphiprion ocellaris]
MTSVEKRRSGRKSGGHRKHSDGGYSDTSSGGSFLDENDREVSNLTDRAFRSLCIGDEAVYNDSDLCLSSPCTQRDRQMAFSHDRDRGDKEREELKRAAHENFSLRVQQYGQDWIHGGMYGAEIHRDPQWDVYGERTQGRISATFQNSFVETCQQEKSLREEQLSFLSNGASELSSQQHRSRSRVSSLIRAFNSDGHRDVAGMDDKVREWNDEASWDKSALMSIQQELSEFSTSYQQNFHSGHFPSAGSFSSRDANFYSSEVAEVAHMSHNSASSFMRSSHSKHSMSAQVNCNSNFFIHSEFSPFRVWRDHNRFPFQRGEMSGFMHCSEFPKWYETPMYNELSMQNQPYGPYQGMRHPRSNMAPVVPPNPPRSTSTSTMLQKASAVEKRCESELAGHYPHRKRSQSLGANRLPSQRRSTASPTIEMSRRVRDTISSVKALQQKIKMMSEQNITAGVIENQQGVLYSHENMIPFGNNPVAVAPNVNTSTTPFNISQLLTPLVHSHQEAVTSDFQPYGVSPLPVEHAPVRAESRGATPDVRMSSYKSRATSLLFNLKDNRKRVKSTYSPPKFKGLETNKQQFIQEPQETVIDMPDFPEPEIQFLQLEESGRTNAAVNQYHNPGLPYTMLDSQPAAAHTGQYPEYTFGDYQTAQMQGQMVHHSGFTGFIPENYTSNQLANGQNLNEALASFAPYKQGVMDNMGHLAGDVYRLKASYAETSRLNVDNNQSKDYLISKANMEQPFNETVGRVFTKVDRYEQFEDNKHDYNNVSSQDMWRQTNSQDTEKLSLKAATSPWKQESMMEKTRQGNQSSINEELEKVKLRENLGIGSYSYEKADLVNTNMSDLPPPYSFSNNTVENPAYYGQQQPLAFKDKNVLQKYSRHTEENEVKENNLTQNYNRYADQEYRSQFALYSTKEKYMAMEETGQMKHTPNPNVHEVQNLQPTEAKPQFEHNRQKKSLSNPDNTSAPTTAKQMKNRQYAEVKAEQVMSEHLKVQHAQAELAKAQQWAQVEQPKADSAKLNLAGQTGSEKVKTEQAKSEVTKQESVKQAKTEHIKEEIRKGGQTGKSREKQPEEQTKALQTRVRKVTDEPRNITEEAPAEHMRWEQGIQVKAEQAEAERLKEELIKTEQPNTEQADQERIKRAKTKSATGKRINERQAEQEKLSAKQVEREQREAKTIGTEKVNAEQAEAEHRKGEQTKTEQSNKKETKAEQVKLDQVEKIKTEHIKAEDVRQAKDLIQVGRVNAVQSTTLIGTAKDAKPEERKAEHSKMERTKVEQAKAELPKSDNMQERSDKLTAKLTATQVKSEPDKVEQVKTELAKAKAELAKIKEKMRGEQKEKVKNTVTLKEDDIAKNNVSLHLNVSKNKDHKKPDQAAEKHQQNEASAVITGSSQAYRGADDYDHLREKYGFTNAISASKNKLSTTGNVSSNDASETQVLPLDKAEKVNTEKSKDECSPANTENKEEGNRFKSSEVTENQYVYSESSKEFKLSSVNDPPINVDKRANGDSVADKVKDDSAEKLKRRDPIKDAEISLQRDSDLTKPLPHERKPKSTEHNIVPGKDLHFTPPKALSHKERAHTKQEILTSKIKAHAEKEISAIKEGFAIRDGLSSKNSSKQLGGIQSVNIRQRPPSQEGSKKHESTSNITPKQQTEPLGGQMEPVKSVSPPSSTTIPAKSAATKTQLADHSQKQETRKPLKSNSEVSEPPRKTNQTENYNMSTTEDLVQNQKQENQPGVQSPVQNKEQTPKIDQGKQQANHGEIPGKQKEELKDNPAINTDNSNKKTEAPSQTSSSKSVMTERAESKEAAHEDSEPTISLVLGQSTAPVTDDSLQIMGIMVTVRERKPSVSTDDGDNTSKTQTERECNISELDKHHLNSGREAKEKISSSKELSVAKTKDIQEKEDQTEVGVNKLPETVQENSSLETRKNNVTENVTGKRTNLQQETSSINAKLQRETPPEPLGEKGMPFTATVPAKNKVLPETQPHLHKQDTIAREMKDHADKMPKEKSAKSTSTDEVQTNTRETNPLKIQTSENFTAKKVNTGINRHDAEPLQKHGMQPSVKEDMASIANQSKSSSIDDKSAKLPDEKTHDSAPPKTSNKVNPSSNLTENENRCQYNKTHIEQNNQKDDNVHIDCIAIRVVPAVTEKDSVTMVGKHHMTTFSSDAVLANEHKQVASSSCDQKAIPFNSQDQAKDLPPASSEKMMTDSLEDKIRVQEVLSSVRKLSDSLKISNKQNSTNTTSGITQAENENPEKLEKNLKLADESNIQPMEGDYFQVQGASNNEPHNNSATVGDASKGRELSALQQNKTVVSNESYKEGKTGAFVFNVDPDKRKAVESSSVSIQDESIKKKKWERDDKLASKQTDGSMERWSNNAMTEAVQANLIRKHHTENKSGLSAMERQSSRNSHATKENMLKENPQVKPKPKERSSTIPEISALADYARLKVIVSEDTEVNRVQEFPPNKKEGFFPLIQTRHSRRPVFTTDPQDFSVKEKNLPSKTETSAKVNKEPKAPVYPITEKEHQRTGMFKLGDKEKMLLDAKVNEGAAKDAHHKERIKPPAAQTEQMAGAGTQIVNQDQKVYQPNDPLLQATTSAVNRPRNTTEGLTYLDKNSLPHENMTSLIKDERNEQQQDKDTGAKTEDGRADKLKNERLATLHEETKAKSQGRIKQVEEDEASRSKEEKREDDMRIKHMIEESRASLAEEERRVIQREEERRAREREAIAIKIKERREKQREAERTAEEERKAKQKEGEKAAQKEEEIRARQREEEMKVKKTEERRAKLREEEKRKREEEERRRMKKQQEERAAQEEQRKRAAQKEQMRVQDEQKRRAVQEEQQRRATLEEQQRRAAQEEQQRRAALEEQQRRAAQEEQQRRATLEEQQRRAAQEEQQRRATLEEQQRRAAQEEQQRRAALEEQQRRAAQEEQQRRAALEEQQRRAAQEEQQRRAAQEEQQRRAAQEEQQRRIQEEQKRRAAHEEQQRRAALEEQQRRAAQEEEQRRAAQEEQQRRAQEEQKRRAALEEQQRRAGEEEQQRKIQEEQKRRATQEEQQRRAAQEEQKRRAGEEEKQMRAAQEEQQRRAVQEEQQRRVQEELKRRAALEEQKRRAAQEEQQRQDSLDEEQRRVKQADKIRKEEKIAYISEAERFKHIQAQKKAEQQIEEQRREHQKKEEWMKTQREEEKKKAVEKVLKQREEKQVKEERIRLLDKSQAPPKEEKRAAPEVMLSKTEDEIQAKKREEEMFAAQRENVRAAQMEKQNRAAQMDTLQYYAITSRESERTSRERQILSPLPPQQRSNPSGLESTNDSQTRHYRPHASPSPAPSLPRSTTSSPALGAKPSMFRVKDNTIRGSSLTKSVKPRFHKNFGEDFWMGSPVGSERGEEEQETMRHSAGTPVHPDAGFNRLAAINESSTFQSASSSLDYSAHIPHHRPYSRRSIAMDEDDSRSVISNMSEDVESFATSAADLADIRGLYDSERPESACSFSSDVSRSMGKPPAVPPKSEKALRRAKRLTSRRINKELSKVAENNPAGLEKDVSSIPSSSSFEVRSSNRHAVASPHFSAPVSLAHAPTLGSSLPSSHTEHQSSHRSFHASPHATGPVSLPVSSAHATATVSLPTVSPNITVPASQAITPKTVAHVPSSPTLHRANHPAPVTQYQVESSYPQSYPVTQRKVLQDLGSGQYFVVDVPVPVKTKTFFDPETGKYVQLNVRESGQSISQPQPQHQPQMQIKPQQQPLPQTSPAGKPFGFYQGYNGYPQGYQPAAVNSVHSQRSSVPATLHQEQQPVRESHNYGYPAPEIGQNSEVHRYSPEKNPYMDTVNDKDKTYNRVYNTHGSYESFPECDTNSQLAGSSICENDNSAPSQYQSRDIITMSELEDFMDASDW